MKKKIARFLNKYRIFLPLLVIYHSLHSFKHVSLKQEIKLRFFRPPEGLKFPPSRLIFKIIGHGWRSIYYGSGRLIVDNIKSKLESQGIRLDDMDAIMDFGCGCGRLLRHFKNFKINRFYGSDYNPVLIKWCRNNLKFATFGTNQLKPPLAISADSFDLIYSQSVFTHLSEELQQQWLRELYRLLKPGGVLYFTSHGDQFLNVLNEAEKISYKKGEIVIQNIESEGENICASFQTPDYFRKQLKSGFEYIAYFPGEKTTHLQQDINIFRKTNESVVFN